MSAYNINYFNDYFVRVLFEQLCNCCVWKYCLIYLNDYAHYFLYGLIFS